MALQLKRITWPYDCVKCDITRKLLAYGDYYYEYLDRGLLDRKVNGKTYAPKGGGSPNA